MATNDLHDSDLRPVGYAALIDHLGLQVIPNGHESMVTSSGTHRIDSTGDIVRETYINRYWPGEGLGDHLEFALKYDGTNLAILASIFRAMDVNEFTTYIQSKPMGKYARRLWYLYELITGHHLPIKDLTRGSYVDLLDPEKYYTISTPTPMKMRILVGKQIDQNGNVTNKKSVISRSNRQVRRQRVNDNLLGDARFCPMIRRTETLRRFEETNLRQRCQEAIADYPVELIKRALSYLYTKETKSSFEIERIKPDANRTERFIAQLQLAEKEDFCDKRHLVELQNRIVDPRFADPDYRTSQNYVGETVSWKAERIHFICPKPEDLPNLMDGLFVTHQRLGNNGVHPVIHAATVAYGFVFLHPFEDGNGRIHRFLIHNILARRDFTPNGLMFPVSAAMLKNPADYDASLEAFSKSLMPLVEYSLDEEGRMVVHNDTAVWYRHIDMTAQTESLFSFIEKTIDTELIEELNFLANYDRTKAEIQAIVDMPDRQIDLFIRFCLQNKGRLSARKRENHFNFLTDTEVSRMEQSLQAAYGKDQSSERPE